MILYRSVYNVNKFSVTLYHYFANKDALIHEVIKLQTERVLKAQQPHLDALDSLLALRMWRNAVIDLNKDRKASEAAQWVRWLTNCSSKRNSGGLLLSETTRSSRPLELAFDMALEHVARHIM